MPTGSASPITSSSSSSPSIRTPSIAPSAARMPQRICAASNAGPAGAAVASTRSCDAERDLAVRAHVDEQAQAAVARQPGREQAGDDVAADVGAHRREDERGRARVHRHAEVGARAAGGSSCAATTNGAIDSGSGSIPSASWVIVTLPHSVIS